jgi:hypothetical protein
METLPEICLLQIALVPKETAHTTVTVKNVSGTTKLKMKCHIALDNHKNCTRFFKVLFALSVIASDRGFSRLVESQLVPLSAQLETDPFVLLR